MSGRSIATRIIRRLSHKRTLCKVSSVAKAEKRRDHRGLPQADPGSPAVINASIKWLCAAQDNSLSHDGGVARDYSLIDGWASSYPETTGYIVPTFLKCAQSATDGEELKRRAHRMLEWLVEIQMSNGAYQGGRIDSTPVVPVTFNTGQIVLGLAAGEDTFGNFQGALQRAADWLVRTQDPDGCWRQYPTPFAAPGEKTYETHVAWGLFEAARLYPSRGYAEAGLANIKWALQHQRENGWLEKCCLDDPSKPLTHTLGYALRGVIEAFRLDNDPRWLTAACRTADGLLSALRGDGFLPGRLSQDWSSDVTWACLTGTAQIAHSWLLLFAYTGDKRYRDAGLTANRYVRRTVQLDGVMGVKGGVKGSFPVDGDYDQYRLPNWAAKFLIDSLMQELELPNRAVRAR